MKKIIQLPLVAFCALSVWSMSSCKKSDDNNTVCHIKTISSTSGSTTSLMALSYNSDGKLASVIDPNTSTGFSRLFTYSGNTINVTEKNGSGTTTSIMDVTLNSSGKITNIIAKNGSGVLQTTYTITYDGNGNLASFTSTPTSGSPDVSVATFSNGNLATYSSGTGTTTLDYFTDKSFQDGDYIKLFQWLQYGALYIVNNNLFKSMTSSGGSTTATYEMDNTGKISKMTLTSGSSSSVYAYTYECN